MDWRAALTFWKNTARKAVGLPAIYPVKIVRDEIASAFPLIGIKKEGDVGYDLPATERVVIPAATPEMMRRYRANMQYAQEAVNAGYSASAEVWRREAMECLPKAAIPTGVRIEMPNTIWASVEARSSTSSLIILTPDAIIDAGYRGELFAVVFNLGFTDHTVEIGDRLVQVIFHERILAQMREVDALSDSERGTSGFGSTGQSDLK